jgi:trimeric autotransporter adhesin
LNATNAAQLGGTPANQFLTTTNANANYIQNTTNQQLGSNFNISGNGTLGGTLTSNAVNSNVVDAANQYNISGIRVLSIVGSSNLFVGENSGFGNTTGGNNSFVGPGAGFTNSIGGDNAYFGTSAGQNATGSSNSFFGMNSGTSNTLGSNNTLIGKLANVSTGNLTNATAIGANSLVSRSNSLVLGSGVNVGIGTTAPNFKPSWREPQSRGLHDEYIAPFLAELHGR